MPRSASLLSTIVCGLVLGFANPGLAAAAGTPPGGRSNVIICWTDNNGRQVGCGYTVPPEYANNPTRALNARGITLLVVTHDDEVAARSRRHIRMRDGRAVRLTAAATPRPKPAGPARAAFCSRTNEVGFRLRRPAGPKP
jgi:hypothetical protein